MMVFQRCQNVIGVQFSKRTNNYLGLWEPQWHANDLFSPWFCNEILLPSKWRVVSLIWILNLLLLLTFDHVPTNKICIQTCSTWQWIMWLFKFRPAMLDHKLATNDLCWTFRATVSHMRALPVSTLIVGSETSTRVMLMLFLITQSFPFSDTKAAASKARELPKWCLLSMNLVHVPVFSS